MKLAKSGYYSGDPDLVKNAPLDTVIQIICFENFTADVEEAFRELNKK